MYHSKYALVIYERSPDGSLSINTHTITFMQMVGCCQTPDDYLTTALGWYDKFSQLDILPARSNILS
jgi:hypothetical protein